MVDEIPQNTEINGEKLERYKKFIISDSADEATYKEIYTLLPEDKIVEKDRVIGDMSELGVLRKTTKRKLNKEQDKELVDKLKAFALERKLGLNNKLFFNDHFEDIYIRSVYIVNE